MHVLILGGSAEARELASILAGTSGISVTSSLAGRVARPVLPVGDVRTGGFGGVPGLREWLRSNAVDVVVDATHPFAAAMSAGAAAACAAEALPLIAVRRPEWTAAPGDRWTRTDSLEGAARILRDRAQPRTVLSAIGRQGVGRFAAIEHHHFILRCIDPPDGPVPVRSDILTARGPFTLEGELALLGERGVDVVVNKNSGGTMAEAKLVAARRLGLEVIMVDRPPLPGGVVTVDRAQAAVDVLSGVGRLR